MRAWRPQWPRVSANRGHWEPCGSSEPVFSGLCRRLPRIQEPSPDAVRQGPEPNLVRWIDLRTNYTGSRSRGWRSAPGINSVIGAATIEAVGGRGNPSATDLRRSWPATRGGSAHDQRRQPDPLPGWFGIGHIARQPDHRLRPARDDRPFALEECRMITIDDLRCSWKAEGRIRRACSEDYRQ